MSKDTRTAFGKMWDEQHDLSRKIGQQRKQIKQLEQERDGLKADRQELIRKNKFLRERKDLPVDRIPAYEAMKRENGELKAHCEQLSSCLANGYDNFSDLPYNEQWFKGWLKRSYSLLMEQTRTQSLNEIKAQAVEEAVTWAHNTVTHYNVTAEHVKEYAKKLREENNV